MVIYYDGRAEGQCTVVMATHGPLAGRRVVRSREPECATFYRRRVATVAGGG